MSDKLNIDVDYDEYGESVVLKVPIRELLQSWVNYQSIDDIRQEVENLTSGLLEELSNARRSNDAMLQMVQSGKLKVVNAKAEYISA